MQLACYEIGKCLLLITDVDKCAGGNSFYELKVLQAFKINNGSVLVDGRISWEWQNIMFWRTFICMVFHYCAILLTCSLSLKLGIIKQNKVES